MQKKVQIQKICSQIDEAIRNGYVFQVKDLLEAAKKDFPNEPIFEFYQAEYHLLAWEYQPALEILEGLVRRYPEEPRYAQRYAVAKFKNQDRAGAIALFERLTEEYPEDADLHFSYGKELVAVSWEGEELQKAIRALTHVLVLDPNRLEAYTERATAHQNMGNYEQALDDLSRVLEAEPNNNSVRLRRISLQTFLKNSPAVHADYATLLALQPEDVSHLYNYAQFCYKEADYPKAIELLNKQIEIEFANEWVPTGATSLRGEVFAAMGKTQEALADYNYSLSQNSGDYSTLLLRAKLHLQMGKGQDFLADIAQAMAQNSFGKHEYIMLRGDYYLNNARDLDAAEADYRQLIEDPEMMYYKKDGYFGLGKVAQARGDIAQAYEHWTKAKEEYHDQAQAQIDTYCGDFLQKEQAEFEQNLRADFEGEAEKNALSPILQTVFGKTWKLDIDLSMQKSPAMTQIPQSLLSFFVEAFRHISVDINAEQIILQNPMNEGITAYYRVEDETENAVHIYGQPVDGKEPRHLEISREGEYMTVAGLMSGMGGEEQASIAMYFRQAGESELTAEPETKEQAEARIKKIAENFIGELISTVVEGLENLENMVSPKGEAASDDAPPQEHTED